MIWHLSKTTRSIRQSALRGLIIVTMGSVVGACDYVERWAADPQPSMTGGGWLTNYSSYKETFDLISALDPKGLSIDKSGPTVDAPIGKKIDAAFISFYDPAYNSVSPNLRRNRVQERMLAVSNGRCVLFKNLLYELRSKTNFWLGTLTTVTGVAGGIVTGAAGSRILSGAAGAISGTRAEFNQELFQNLATQVIIEGIDVRRREIYEQIVQRGQAKTIDEYSVEAAVKDAIFYHAQCNVVTGFQVAQDSIKTVEDPGIQAANKTLARLATTRALLQSRQLTPEEAAKLVNTSATLLGLAGKPKIPSVEDRLPVRALPRARSGIKAAIEEYIEFVKENVTNGVSKDKLVKPLESAQEATEASLKACEPLAIAKSTEAFKAIVEANLESVDADKQAKLEVKKEKAVLEASQITTDIEAVRRLFVLHLQQARAVIAGSLDEKGKVPDNKIDEVAAKLVKALSKPVGSGVCQSDR